MKRGWYGGVGLIYIPPQDSFSDEILEFAREWLYDGVYGEAESKLVWLIDHYNIQRVHPAKHEPRTTCCQINLFAPLGCFFC